MAPQARTNLESFLDSVLDAHLVMNQYSGEETIKADFRKGFRLDHQGTNNDETVHPWTHRIYVQPVGGSKSKSHRQSKANNNKSILADCHASESATAEEIRDALMKSFRKGAQVFYAPPKPE
ncbi:hypothetical protein QBC37DRAFT_403729 [Rhypophila decipiens]|uniref:Uncharacterized protein n=1 Tax=Rhypophila decipiens TaxID=261697 RepID=A0AAN7B4X2_9PEZI|nr:hypothetical protein QBC37DRAFT_403729 [Rhypophila decipiens]